MCKTVIVTMFYSIDDFAEVIFGHWLVKFSREFHYIKKLTLICHIKNQIVEDHWNISHRSYLNSAILLKADYIFMLRYSLQSPYLILDELFTSFACLWDWVEYLYGDLPSSFCIKPKSNSTAATMAKVSDNFISI